jgi:hypothetical protein
MTPRPPNRLGKEKSPYLHQHAGNPVDWHPWGEEVFARALAALLAAEGKPHQGNPWMRQSWDGDSTFRYG